MDTLVTRNFRVKGHITSMFTPEGGTATAKNIGGLRVELWHKAPLEVVFLGDGLTDEAGDFIVDFDVESPTVMIENGKINEVFLKLYYGNKIIAGDLDDSAGSFD
jgi:hypothetical protein